MSNFRKQSRQNSGDNVFKGIPVGKEEPTLFATFLDSNDFTANSRRAFIQDARKFATWFSSANKERFVVGRVTTRDVSDFRDHLRERTRPSGCHGQSVPGDGAAVFRLA